MGNVRGKRTFRWLPHQGECASHLVVGYDLDDRRLLKVYGQRLGERVVEARVTRVVAEVCDHDPCWFVGRPVSSGKHRVSRSCDPDEH
jgi:hypothetical protein